MISFASSNVLLIPGCNLFNEIEKLLETENKTVIHTSFKEFFDY